MDNDKKCVILFEDFYSKNKKGRSIHNNIITCTYEEALAIYKELKMDICYFNVQLRKLC